MTRTTATSDTLSPEELSLARRSGIVMALANQALKDSDYTEALIIATANVIGLRSVSNGVPLDDILDVIRNVAGDVIRANTPVVLQ